MKIKKLDWKGPEIGMCIGDTYIATTLGNTCRYWIYDYIAGRKRYNVYTSVNYFVGKASTLDGAKELAQMHLEKIINDTIET